ncbi:MAG: hypothetical protein QM767_16460 [Anaeromyxobacter sp.]
MPMTRTPIALLILLLAACGSGPRLPKTPSGPPQLEVKGAVKGGPFQLGEADLKALPHRTVQGVDPVTGRAAAYEGVDLGAILARVELRPGADILVLRTADKRAVPVPLSLVRQYRPVLAERADGAPVEGRLVAWPSGEQRGIATDPRAIQWWARDLTALEVVNGARVVSRALTVPEAAPDGARIGAGVFGWRCLGCHQVRGVGGQKGPDLTRAADHVSLDALRKLLPSHPGWIQRGLEPPPEEAPAQLHAFLRMAAAQAALGPDGNEPPPDEEDEGRGKKQRPPPPGEED